MKILKCWLFTSVSKKEYEFLLNYQEKKLIDLCNQLGGEILGVSKIVLNNNDIIFNHSFNILINRIKCQKIDCILIYDKTRLFHSEFDYAEFYMFCDMHNVQIISVNRVKQSEISIKSN